MSQWTNPVLLLVGFLALAAVVQALLLPEGYVEGILAAARHEIVMLGLWGYVLVTLAYVLCSFFFIPLLITLNVVCGALFGPALGSAVSLVGISLGSVASAISVRYVFQGIHRSPDRNRLAKRIVRSLTVRGDLMVVVVRLAFFIPYQIQNIVIGVSDVGITRLGLLTAMGALPGVVAYNLVGAGFMQIQDIEAVARFGAAAVAIVGIVYLALAFLRRKNRPLK